MLFNILLNAGQFTEVAKQGRHINLVLAAGELTVRAMTAEGQINETQIIAGMSFALPTDFARVAFSSDTSQQIKCWLSMYPLTYSSETSRTVGSNAITSTYAEAYSGDPKLLLEAVAGRNKVTISPSQDILIGGVGLSLKTGIPVTAGSVFEFNTQGAVFALETSGAYPPVVSTEATPANFAAPSFRTTFSTSYKMLAANVIANEYWLSDGVATARRYNADTGVELGSFAAAACTSLDGKIYDTGDYFEWGRKHNIADIARWIKVHKTTYAVTQTDIGFSANLFSTVYNGIRYVLDTVAKEIWTSSDGISWTKTVGVAPYTDPLTVKGIDINSAGHLFLVGGSTIYKSTDIGATWTSNVIALGMDTEANLRQMAINKNNGKIYICSNTANHSMAVSVDDGVTFNIIPGWQTTPLGGAVGCYSMHFVGDTLYVSGSENMYQYNENVGLATYARTGLSTVSAVHAGNDGRIYWKDNDGLYFVQGALVESGGVPVAIMAEVN